MPESAISYLQDALQDLNNKIEKDRLSLHDYEMKLEELSRNLDQYMREKALIEDAIKTFLNK